MTPDVWAMTLATYANDPRMEGAAYRELWSQGWLVEEISGLCRVDEWRVQQALRGER